MFAISRLVIFLACLISLWSHDAMAGYRAEQYFEGADLAAVKALELGDEVALKRAMLAGADINRPGKQGVVPFLYFIVTNNSSAMVRLCKLNARFDYQLPRALGPKFPEDIGWIAANPDTRMLEAMLNAGLDPNMKTPGDGSFLYFTLNPFNKPAFELLLHHGANINAQDSLGRTVLHDAVFQESYDLAAFLVDRGANPLLRTNTGRTVPDLLRRKKERVGKDSPIEREINQLLDYLASKGYH